MSTPSAANKSAVKGNLRSDLMDLRRKFAADGLFDFTTNRFALEISFVFLALNALAYLTSHFLLQFSLFTVSQLRLIWIFHDVGHSQNKFVRKHLDLSSSVFIGHPAEGFSFNVHSSHHANVNVLKHDPALDSGFFKWHPSELKGRSRFHLLTRPFQWFVLLLPFSVVSITKCGYEMAIRKRRWDVLLIVFFRWSLLAILMGKIFPWFALSHVLAFFLCGVMASLNHFHLPISFEKTESHTEHIFHVTQDFKAKYKLLTWIMGGLNFHIEHHLFPQMPSHNLHLVSPVVRQLAHTYNLPYHECSIPGAISLAVKKMMRP